MQVRSAESDLLLPPPRGLSWSPLEGGGGDTTRNSVLILLFGDVAFSEYFLYHCRFSLCTESTLYQVCFFLPGGAFLPCDHGLDF